METILPLQYNLPLPTFPLNVNHILTLVLAILPLAWLALCVPLGFSLQPPAPLWPLPVLLQLTLLSH